MLPIVKEEIGFTIQEEFRNSEGSDYICETLERMGKENPASQISLPHIPYNLKKKFCP